MKQRKKLPAPPKLSRPVRSFDRAVSQIVAHIKRGEPSDALVGITKALKLQNLSDAQKAELYLHRGHALYSTGNLPQATLAFNESLKRSGALSRRYVRIYLALSLVAYAEAKQSRKQLNLETVVFYIDIAAGTAKHRGYTELQQEAAQHRAALGLVRT